MANRYGLAQYLLGQGPLPPPTRQQLAVAQMHAMLDQGAFENPGGGTLDGEHFEIQDDLDADLDHSDVSDELAPYYNWQGYLPPPPPSQPRLPSATMAGSSAAGERDVARFSVEVTNYQSRPPTKVLMSFAADVDTAQLIRDVRGTMHVAPEETIGWKESQERRRDPYRALNDAGDAQTAIQEILRIKSKRTKRETRMEVVKLEAQPNGSKVRAAEKRGETATTSRELAIVHDKLKCAQHPKRLCYVLPPTSPTPGEHVEVAHEMAGLWAHMIKRGEAPEDCSLPPNCLKLDEAMTQSRNTTRNARRGRNQPEIHVHVNGNSNSDADGVFNDRTNVASAKRSHAEVDSESDDDEDDDVAIADVVDQLEQKYPALDYKQYLDALKGRGIVYASTAIETRFDDAYYEKEIGMAAGAIGKFKKKTKAMLKTLKKGKKRARVAGDEQNEDA